MSRGVFELILRILSNHTWLRELEMAETDDEAREILTRMVDGWRKQFGWSMMFRALSAAWMVSTPDSAFPVHPISILMLGLCALNSEAGATFAMLLELSVSAANSSSCLNYLLSSRRLAIVVTAVAYLPALSTASAGGAYALALIFTVFSSSKPALIIWLMGLTIWLLVLLGIVYFCNGYPNRSRSPATTS